MNLEELIRSGALLSSANDGPIKKKATWEGKVFDVLIKREMSAADFEYIFKDGDDDDSRMARRVHRLIYLADGERIPYETAKQFKPSLLLSLVMAINEAHKPIDAGDVKVKKNLRQKKSSGTN